MSLQKKQHMVAISAGPSFSHRFLWNMLGILRGLEPCLFQWKCHSKKGPMKLQKTAATASGQQFGGAVSVEKWEKKEPNNANIRLHYDGYI